MTRKITKLSEVDPQKDTSFEWNNKLFILDLWLKNFFTKHFGMSIKSAYCPSKNSIKIQRSQENAELRWNQTTILLFLENGNILRLENSEWASFYRNYD